MIKTHSIFLVIFLIVLVVSSTTTSLTRYNLSDIAAITIGGEANLASRALWLVLFCLLVVVLAIKPSRSTLSSPIMAFVVLYILMIILSGILSNYAMYSLTRAFSFTVYILSAPTAAILSNSLRGFIRQQRTIFYILILSILFSIILFLASPGQALSEGNRLAGIFSYPNMMARIAALVIIYIWVMPRRWFYRWERMVGWILTPILLLIILKTESRSTIIGLFVGFLYPLWRIGLRGKLWIIPLSALLMIAVLLFRQALYSWLLGFLAIFPHTQAMTPEQELVTFTGRTYLWTIIFANFPITLVGIGYKLLFHGDYGSTILSNKPTMFGGAHNAYIEPLIEIGVVGIIILAILLLLLILKIRKLNKSHIPEIRQFECLITTVLIFIFSQSFLESLFDNNNIFFWLFLYYGFAGLRLSHMDIDKPMVPVGKLAV